MLNGFLEIQVLNNKKSPVNTGDPLLCYFASLIQTLKTLFTIKKLISISEIQIVYLKKRSFFLMNAKHSILSVREFHPILPLKS